MSKSFTFLPKGRKNEATNLLPWVMAIMVYLSALSAAGSLLLHKGFDDWASSLQGRITVQLTGDQIDELAQQTNGIQQVLNSTPGIQTVRILERHEITELLEPWLGSGNITDDLPVPVLIDVQTSPDTYVNLDALDSKLKDVSDNVYLDDHAQWLSHFYNLTNTIEFTALGILLMVFLASICIVMFATKTNMAEHKSTIEIIHLMGAHDQLIAKAYQGQFMKYGLKGGIIGLAIAYITIFGLMHLIQELATGLVDVPAFPYMTLAILILFPAIFALIAMYTARITVMRELRRMI